MSHSAHTILSDNYYCTVSAASRVSSAVSESTMRIYSAAPSGRGAKRLQNAEVHVVLTMLSPMKPRKKFDAIICFPSCELPSFTIVIHSSHSVCRCTILHGCDTNFIAFLYKAWRTLHTHIIIPIYKTLSQHHQTAVVVILASLRLAIKWQPHSR